MTGKRWSRECRLGQHDHDGGNTGRCAGGGVGVAEQTTEVTSYIVDFHHRPHGGPTKVGPFGTRLEAELFLQRLADREDNTGVWTIVPLYTPEF